MTVSNGPFGGMNRATPIPARYRCTHTYASTHVLTTGAAGVYGTEQVFRLNSLYDPDFTGAGHQPYGFNQMEALYGLYKVYGVKISIVFANATADSMILGATIQPSNATTTLTGKAVDVVKEQPMAITRMFSSSDPYTLNQYIHMHKLEGVRKQQYDYEMSDYAAVPTANPTQNPWLRVAVADARGNAGATCVCRVLLKFYTVWTNRKTQSQST